jgi:hypothetical protein
MYGTKEELEDTEDFFPYVFVPINIWKRNKKIIFIIKKFYYKNRNLKISINK